MWGLTRDCETLITFPEVHPIWRWASVFIWDRRRIPVISFNGDFTIHFHSSTSNRNVASAQNSLVEVESFGFTRKLSTDIHRTIAEYVTLNSTGWHCWKFMFWTTNAINMYLMRKNSKAIANLPMYQVHSKYKHLKAFHRQSQIVTPSLRLYDAVSAQNHLWNDHICENTRHFMKRVLNQNSYPIMMLIIMLRKPSLWRLHCYLIWTNLLISTLRMLKMA